MRRNELLIFIVILFAGYTCSTDKDNYPKDKTISNVQGIPNDSLTFYFPATITINSQIIKTNIDTFNLNWYSSALFCAKEPILFNYYQGHDIYRFLWLRSFHRPMVFSLHKDGDKVWLTTKELDRQPQFINIIYGRIKFTPPILTEDGELDTTTKMVESKKPKVDSVVKANRQARIILNQTKQLSIKDWTEFESLLNACSFWTTTPINESFGLDGSEWTIEGHIKNKYWFVNRWSPSDSLRKPGEYLIKKSGLKEEIY